ncbi:MAG: hypothetical protein RLW61_11735 [Gammaproteobacteria bacterium]
MNGTPGPRYDLRLLSALVLSAVIAAPASGAVTLQPSRFFERLDGHFVDALGDELTPETLLIDRTLDGIGSADGFVATSGGARPRAEVQMNIAMGPGASRAYNQVASAEIRYYWAIEQVGGIPYGDRVPVELDTRALASYTLATDLNFGLTLRATAFFEIADEASWTFSALPCRPICAPGTGAEGFHEVVSGHATPNLANRIQLTAVATASLYRDTSLAATVWVDPVITISPDFARRDDFRIVYGSFVEAVPLPAPALLLLSALLPFSLGRWRRAG